LFVLHKPLAIALTEIARRTTKLDLRVVEVEPRPAFSPGWQVNSGGNAADVRHLASEIRIRLVLRSCGAIDTTEGTRIWVGHGALVHSQIKISDKPTDPHTQTDPALTSGEAANHPDPTNPVARRLSGRSNYSWRTRSFGGDDPPALYRPIKRREVPSPRPAQVNLEGVRPAEGVVLGVELDGGVDKHCGHRVSVLVAEQCSASERRDPLACDRP
jgi:hypothetical protein